MYKNRIKWQDRRINIAEDDSIGCRLIDVPGGWHIDAIIETFQNVGYMWEVSVEHPAIGVKEIRRGIADGLDDAKLLAESDLDVILTYLASVGWVAFGELYKHMIARA